MIPISPAIIPMPFAQEGDRSTIPEEVTTSGSANASWKVGFPPITRISKNAGGKPPLGIDFQSIFNTISNHLFWLQSGGVYAWSNKLNYLAGAHVRGSNGEEYRCLSPNGPDMPSAVGYVGAVDPVGDTNGFWTREAVPIVDAFTGASASTQGKAGLVPVPNQGQQNLFLRGDGNWAAPTDTHYSAGNGLSLSGTTFSLASSGVTQGSYGPNGNQSPAHGASFTVPQITVDAYGRATAITNRTITLPQDQNTQYSASTGLNLNNGAFSIANTAVTAGQYGNTTQQSPANGGTFNIPYFKVNAQGQVTDAGTTTVKLPNISGGGATYTDFVGATASTAGSSGLVPAPAAGQDTYFLRGDGTWQASTVSVPDASTSVKGIVQLSDATNGTSSTKAATEKAVGLAYSLASSAKSRADDAYDLASNASSTANNALLKTGGSMTGAIFEAVFTPSGNDIDVTKGAVFYKTIGANTTLTFNGVPTGKAASFSLVLTNGGAYTVTWPSSVKWAYSTVPDLTASGVDVITFLTGDGGTTWFGVPSTKDAG